MDGFKAAALLSENEDYYDALASQQMFFHASGNEGLSIQPSTPVTTLVHGGPNRSLSQVRWNNADRGAFVQGISRKSRNWGWYKGAKEFNRILHSKDPAVRQEFQMKPGRPLSTFGGGARTDGIQLTDNAVFDNWRVLHGRSAFTGARRMAGGYSKQRLILV